MVKEIIKVDWEKITRYNKCLNKSVSINQYRFDFFELFDKVGLDYAVNYLIQKEELEKLTGGSMASCRTSDNPLGDYVNDIWNKIKWP